MTGVAALLALVLAGTGASACDPVIAVVRLGDGATLAVVPGGAFSLRYRHSVTLSDVTSDYRIDLHGSIRQVAERFADLGPGMAHDGAVGRDGDGYILPLDRRVDRLILRASAAAENRLSGAGWQLDLTSWPNEPLEIIVSPCTYSDTGSSSP